VSFEEEQQAAQEPEANEEAEAAQEAEATAKPAEGPESGAEAEEASEVADAAEDAGAPEATEGGPAGETAPEAGADEPQEALGPKERRRRERSRASGPPGPQRTPEQRAGERAERRRAAAESRRRHRAVRRRKHGEPGTGTPAAPREPGSRKVRQGTVVSAGADKTITVEIAVVRRHRTYEKVVRRTSKLHAHDEGNQAHEGDLVRVIESRPLSRTKRWRLLEVLERAPG
jgi:small subunit ribosomal protein S17